MTILNGGNNMFCYNDKCKGNHDDCEIVKNINSLNLDFKLCTNDEEIEMTKSILCLVTSWEEPPYFIIMKRYERGICNAFDGKPIENTRIIKWAYLPEYTL